MGAPLNPVPQVLRFFLEGFVDNDDVYKWGNVLHYHYTGGPPSGPDCATLAAGMAGHWNSDVASLCPSPTQLTSVTCTDLTSDAAAEGEWLGNHVGTRGDDSIPANAAVLISYPAPIRYRGGHPRTYLYVLGNADLEGAAHWAALAVTEVQTKWRTFLADCKAMTVGTTTLDNFGLVRYHGKYLPNGGPPHYYLTTPIFEAIATTSAVAQSEMSSQRRRIGRRKA